MIVEFSQTSSRYRAIAEIGQGGMADVVLAQMSVGGGLTRLVVLKRLWTDLATDPEFVSLFLREARISARMNHPNIVQTYEVLEDIERPATVMEYLDGQPLTAVMNRLVSAGGLPLTLRLRIVAHVLAALDHAHELTDHDGSRHGVVHRDVNPRNVTVTYDGQVKLVDFGLAKSLSADQTRGGGRGSKLAYMAPEQVLGGAIDRRVDIFAVGVMLWEMVSGRRLWQRMADEPIVRHLISGAPIRPLPPNPSLPYGLDRVCARALSIDPNGRFQTAAEFADEIERLLPEADHASQGRRLGEIVSRAFTAERVVRRSLIEQHLRARAVPRLPPPSSVRNPVRPGAPVASWTEDDDASDSAAAFTIDAESILDMSPSTARSASEELELRKTTIYVPRTARRRLRWGAIGFASALALVGGALGIRAALTARQAVPSQTEQPSLVQPVAPKQGTPADLGVAAVSPRVAGPTVPEGSPLLMRAVTHEPPVVAPVRRRNRARPAVTARATNTFHAASTRESGRDGNVQTAKPERERERGRIPDDDVLPPSAPTIPTSSTLARLPGARRPIDTADPFDPFSP